jgi:hypothetical protein
MRLRQVGGRPPQDLVLLLEELDPLVRLTQRFGVAAGLGRARAPGRFFSSIASQRFKHDGEVPKSFATWAIEASESR